MSRIRILPEAMRLILGLIGSLFVVTIRQNRKNRAVVLGVFTVGMFAGFLFYASLEGEHSSPWLLLIVEALIILLGLGVLTYMASDVWRLASGKRESVASGNDQAGGHGLNLK
jgi:4-amino-4-deoxy-L-arabinose transferase-like glycosyltransferase